MRPLYVPVRLAATVLAVATAAGCMSVGDGEGGPARPSQSAGQPGDGVPGGARASGGGRLGHPGGHADGKGGHGKGRGEDDASGSPTASPTSGASAPPPAGEEPGRGGDGKGPDGPGAPSPSGDQPTPPRPTPSDPPPPEPPASPSPEPTVAEPSSSAHEDPRPQLAERLPAPEAGAPV
ncbi:hypothetical protein [Streptomyces longwoodensis]|uniref:hypothetical protein n=1 Tax=Streptomyces longwoodensis TaxID=68231 RepID=UPI0030E29600